MKFIVNRERIEPFLNEIGSVPGLYIDDIDETHISPVIHASDLAPRNIPFRNTFRLLRYLLHLKEKVTTLFADFDLSEKTRNELLTILCYMIAFKNQASDYGLDAYFQDAVRLNLLKAYSILQRNVIEDIVIEIKSRGSDEKATFDHLQQYFPVEKNVLEPISEIFPLNVLAGAIESETPGVRTLKTYNQLLNERIRLPKVTQMIGRLERTIDCWNKKTEKKLMLKSAITLIRYLNFSEKIEQKNKPITLPKRHTILVYRIFQILSWKTDGSRVDNAAYKRFDQALRQYLKDNPLS